MKMISRIEEFAGILAIEKSGYAARLGLKVRMQYLVFTTVQQ